MKEKYISVLAFTVYYLPGYKGGGPIKTITNLVNMTSDVIKYNIITSDRDLGDEKSYSNVSADQWNQVGNSQVFYIKNGFKGLRQIAGLLLNKEYKIVYLNGFFPIRFSFIPLLIAKLIGKSIVLAPRGEFSVGALNIKNFKKKVFISFYKFFKLSNNVIFQASSEFEVIDIRRVLGNEVVVFIAENIGSQKYTENIVNKKNDILRVVFLSRVSPMKNVTYALDVLSNVSCKVFFDIYGPLEDTAYWEQCEEIINRLPANISVSYKGSLDPSNVIETLSAYDLFFMPTKGENYGHVITEALCAGLPVLIADTTPWRDLEVKGLGWDLSLDQPELFVQAIEHASAMTNQEYKEFRSNILSWSKHKFDQRDAIDANIAMFRYAVEKK